MEPVEYIATGIRLKAQGYRTDGCSFVGKWMHHRYAKACWAHDFARAGLIVMRDQAENDHSFRKALRHLGMKPWKSNVIYYFTKTQGWTQDYLGLSVMQFVGILSFLAFIGFVWAVELLQ